MNLNRKLLTISVVLCAVIFAASFAYGAMLYVPGKYSTIQQAVSAAHYGDTIIVGTGSYEENVVLTDGLTLTGLGRPIIGSRSAGSLSASDNCIIHGFDIYGLAISGKANVIVRDCAFFAKNNVLTCLTVDSSQDILLERNIFSDEYYGGITGSKISITNTQDFIFRNNIVLMKNMAESSADITALYMNTVSGASVISNVIKAESANVGIGIALANMANAAVKNNIISAKTYSVYGNSANVTISYNDLPEGVNHVGADVVLGPNNFSCEPVFNEGKGYYLKRSSPCVDSGIVEASDKTEIGTHTKITFLVNGDSLQNAINSAGPNDTVYLGSGTYDVAPYTIKSENGAVDIVSYGILIINKDVRIVGSGKSNTFVKGPVQFIFSNGSLENLTVISPNGSDADHVAEVDYDLDGRWDHDFTGSILIANGSPTVENVMLEPDLSVLGNPPAIPPTGILIIENTSGSPTSPVIRNTTFKKFTDAVKIEGKHDELVLSPVIEHCVFDQNTTGINCDTPYTLPALRNSIFSNMATAIDLAKTPYKKNIIDNIQSNLFYNNTNNCLYNTTETVDILANNRNNQAGDPKYLRPDINVYVTLFDSPAIDINAGLEYYAETKEDGTIVYYEGPNKGYQLAETAPPGVGGDFTKTIKEYDASGAYLGKIVEHFVGTMAELLYYERYNASDVLVERRYADETLYPDDQAGTNPPTVALLAPNGPGLLKGVIPITWTASDPDLDPLSIDIKLSTDGGANFSVNLVSGLENDGVYEWESADYADGSNYKIKVTAYKTNNSAISSEAVSGNVFALDNTPPAISITYPSDNTGIEAPTVTVKINASDLNFGVDPVEVKASDDSDWQAAAFVTDHYEAAVTLPVDGTRAIIVARATDEAGNISTDKIGVIKGYMRFITLPKYYTRSENIYDSAGIAAAKNLIHLMNSANYDYSGDSWGNPLPMPNDSDLYGYGLSHNLPGHQNPGSELDAQGMAAVLQHYDPFGQDTYVGYNFGITAVSDFNTYLKDIVHWLSWAIKKPGVNPQGIPESYPADFCRAPYMAALAPLSAYIEGYSRWVIINGCAADKSPVSTTQPWKSGIVNQVTVYGLFMTDPQIIGIGQDMYIPATSLNDYLQPLGPGISDPYTDKYVSVVEPPASSDFDLDLAEPTINKSTLTLLNVAKFLNNEIADDFSRHLVDGALVVDLNETSAAKGFSTSADPSVLFVPEAADESDSSLNWKDIIPQARLLDGNFIEAVDNSEVRDFIKVHRNDTGEDYYIIPFDKYIDGQYLSKAAVLIDAGTSAVIADSYVKEPVRYVQITKEEAIEAIAKEVPGAAKENMDARLVWQPGEVSSTPFYPYWEVTVGQNKYYVTGK